MNRLQMPLNYFCEKKVNTKAHILNKAEHGASGVITPAVQRSFRKTSSRNRQAPDTA